MTKGSTRSAVIGGFALRTLSGGAALCLFAGFPMAFAQAAAAPQSGAPIPDLSGFWGHGIPAMDFENPPEGGPGPVRNTLTFPPGSNNPIWVGNYQNPILKPWAAEVVKKFGDDEKSGAFRMTATMTCMPSGVPNIHTVLGVVQILQTSRMVLIIHQRDAQVQRVYLNQTHSAHPAASWYGESVGHYEGGDTLVVDTIGMNDKSVVDRNGTPHSDALHVVERYRLTDAGRAIEVRFNVEDPVAFTTPWSAVVKYQRNARQEVLTEEVCAENNFDVITKKPFPIPTAQKADF